MAIPVLERHGKQIAWSASGSISEELAPKPYTITRMVLIQRNIATTTSVTSFNDPWDRIINNLSLSGNGKTYFSFPDMRPFYHLSRFAGFGPPRPDKMADSLTTVDMHTMTVFHFGVQPFRINAAGMIEDNPFDLTAGIPPAGAGNLTLSGAFGAAAISTNFTITDSDIDIYLYGLRAGPGESAPPMPKAIPYWQQHSITMDATSGAFAKSWSVPGGDFLHSMLVMTTNGSNAPRDDSVLNSIQLWNQLDGRDPITYGGQSGAVLDYKAAEMLSQFGSRYYRMPYSDNVTTAMDAIASGGTPGVPTIATGVDSGLVWFPIAAHMRDGGGHPIYGVDMRQVNTGDLQLKFGFSDVTGTAMHVLTRKYQLL